MSWKRRLFGGGRSAVDTPQTKGPTIPGIPDDLAQVIARIQKREVSNDDRLQIAAGLTAADILPISAEILAKPLEPDKPVSDPAKLQRGQHIPGKGIYVGAWQPRDRNGQSLGKIFDLYAAPTGLQDAQGRNLRLTFNAAVQHVAGLRNWHGHDGMNMANDTAVYKTIQDGRYQDLEKWFIPTRDIVDGKDLDGQQIIMPDNLYALKDTGDFQNTFITTSNGSDCAHWYWSCTEHRDNPSNVWNVRFSDGDDDWNDKDNNELSTRLVRAELESPFSILFQVVGLIFVLLRPLRQTSLHSVPQRALLTHTEVGGSHGLPRIGQHYQRVRGEYVWASFSRPTGLFQRDVQRLVVCHHGT